MICFRVLLRKLCSQTSLGVCRRCCPCAKPLLKKAPPASSLENCLTDPVAQNHYYHYFRLIHIAFGSFMALSLHSWHSVRLTALSCQKAQRTIVLAMLQSTGNSQVVLSHKRRTDNVSDVVFGPRLLRGHGHATDSLRSAALACSNEERWKRKGCIEGANDFQ